MKGTKKRKKEGYYALDRRKNKKGKDHLVLLCKTNILKMNDGEDINIPNPFLSTPQKP